MDIIRVFLISDFLAESLKASKTYRKRLLILQYSFAQKTSLILWTSSHLTLKIICPCNTAKSLSEFTKNFPANKFLFGVRKNIALHHFLTPKTAFLKHLESKCPFISVCLRKKRRGKILSDGAWVGRKLNNFIKVSRFLGLVKCF